MKPKRQDALLENYFRGKTKELRYESQSVVAQHAGLRGSHREQLCREFLAEYLPRRYSIGRGIVFDNLGHISRECDIVVWDDQNYPRLPEKGHTLFFANSVRCVVEVKSRWSAKEWKDTLDKTAVLRSLIPSSMTAIGMNTRVTHLEHEVYALHSGVDYEGMVLHPYYIAYAAIFLVGGTTCTPDSLSQSVDDPDAMLPDLTLLLEPGLTIEKRAIVVRDKLRGWVGIRDMKDNALLAFSLQLLALIQDRSVQTENPMVFPQAFDFQLDRLPKRGFEYTFTRPVPLVHPFFVKRYENDSA